MTSKSNVSLAKAIEMNKEAQTYKGIKKIDEAVRVHFMPYTIDIMREVLNFDCSSFTPAESAE